MKTAIYNNEEYTTISEITRHFTDDIPSIFKDARRYVAGAVSSSSIKEGRDYIKLSEEEILANKDALSELIEGMITYNSGLILYKTSKIGKIRTKVIFPINKIVEGGYEKDRFYAKRKDPYDELKYRLNAKRMNISNDMFKALLSVMGRTESGQPKREAVREASKKYDITQKSIQENIKKLELQIHHRAHEDNKKEWGAANL